MKTSVTVCFRLLICSIFLTFMATIANAATIEVDQLRCEYDINPLGIDTTKPRLSWTMRSDERNQAQSSYEVIVSDNLQAINQLKGNVWSSGIIQSDQSQLIEYSGKPLNSFTRYYWRVRVTNQDDIQSPWCPPAWFETALLNETDWQGHWISDGSKNPEKEEYLYKPEQMPLFRKSFSLDQPIASARLYVTGLGYYEAWLNGQRIGDHWLDPGWTSYDKHIMYSAYNITEMLQKGNNTLGLMVGNGWYNPLPLRMWNHLNIRKSLTTGRPSINAHLRVVLQDGTVITFGSDKTWQVLSGPIVKNSVYLGEHYDARLEQSNWCSTGEVNNPTPAVEVPGPGGKLIAQRQPAIKLIEQIKPVGMYKISDGTYIYDMGVNFAGVARIHVQGPAGTTVKLRYGEDVYKDGSLNVMTAVAGQIKNGGGGPGSPKIAWQEDRYTLKGSGPETWSPRFTYHGFRYVEVSGFPGEPDLDSIEGLRLSADLETAGSFECSNPLLNKLHEITLRTFRSNLFSVQSDCPAREKFGYGGDLYCTAESFMYNYNMATFYEKVLRDFKDAQRPLGGFTETAPYVGIADAGPGDRSAPIGWQIAFGYVMKLRHDFYGDQRFIRENYDAYEKQVAFLIDKAKDLLYDIGLSDHESLVPKPTGLSSSSFFYQHVKLAAEFATLLGQKDKSQTYTDLANHIHKAINTKYYNSETGIYDKGTQAAQAFGLWHSLADENAKEKVLQRLLDKLNERQGHLSTGIFGTKMFFDVIRQADINQTAYDLVCNTDFPGWGFMIEHGATTLWETWAYSDNVFSQDHPMFGSVDEWFYRSLLGINAADTGFKKIIIKPQPVKGLTYAKGHYDSIYGRITSAWKIKNDTFKLNVTIPVNTTAEIYVPAKNLKSITESSKPIQQTASLRFLRQEKNYTVFAAGSGHYVFEVK